MKKEYIECDRCDGCGWYEGGKTIQTKCEVCNGTGKIEKLVNNIKPFYVIDGKLGTEFYVFDSSSGGFTASFKDFSISAEGDTLTDSQKNLWNALYDVLKYKFATK